jgi:hypothetical protein
VRCAHSSEALRPHDTESHLVRPSLVPCPSTWHLCAKHLKNEAFCRKRGQIDD